MGSETRAKLYRLGDIFTASFPIELQQLFAGRKEQLQKMMGIIPQKGLHAIIFGDRGVGKTSLANVIKAMYDEPGRQIAKISCSTNDTFDSVWRAVFGKLT